ncbi:MULTISPECIES: alpha/beta fold hydrolase [unclassified Ruegeria]|uniref:alpha/beta fold hydrolase n=1 Tax=unclassified Ruegeria TaxID=2625375 RepID=UPI001487DC7D|nr:MULTISPECIES: alpha/beta fold hydrolase [unclassified Ruegeria]NOD62995.1 alpha/beta fold hydrolase [Ruegeria sp. HKCCD6109]
MKITATTFVLGCLATASWAADPWLSIPAAPEMPSANMSGTAEINGINMYYATYGDGEGTPILMIHGGLAHGDIWAAQVADLAADHTVIVADTRGHGRSTNDGSTYSYGLLSQDYLALLDYLKIDQVHLVGWSDGANIGYSISSTNPERLASHFAHAGNVTLDGIDPSVETNEVFGAYVGMMAEDYAAMSPTPDGFEAFLGGIAAMWSTEKPGGLEALSSITVPTLVVQSAHDEAILMAHSQAISEAIPGTDLLVLEDVSHFASFQKPDAYTQAIRDFIDQ